MEYNSKYHIGQVVFIMVNNKVYNVQIDEITIRVPSSGGVRITYTIQSNPAGSKYTTMFLQDEMFKTKEELLATL